MKQPVQILIGEFFAVNRLKDRVMFSLMHIDPESLILHTFPPVPSPLAVMNVIHG